MPKKAEPEEKPSVQEKAKALLETVAAAGKGRKVDPLKASQALEMAKSQVDSGEALNVSFISKQTGISPPAVKRMLEKNGYTLKTRGKANSNPKPAVSSSNGSSVLGVALEIIRLFKSLPDAEKATVLNELKSN